MLYTKKNYIMMLISFCIIIIGFWLMSGGGSIESREFNPDIFSTRRIVVAPIVCLIGFVSMIYAILYKDKNKDKNENIK